MNATDVSSCEDCFRIICRKCKWEANATEREQVRKGELKNCPVCGWSPSAH